MADDEVQALRDVLYEALSDNWEIGAEGYRRAALAVLNAGWTRQAAAPDGPRTWQLPDAETIARRFHETYERLAPDFGYRTREASAKPWDDIPPHSRALMIHTAMEVRNWLTDATLDGLRTWTPILAEVSDERERQVAKWGEQNHPDGTGRDGDAEMARLDRAKCKANGPDEDNFRDILQEEVSEAFAETHPKALRNELVQVAAVAVQWIEAIDRRSLTDATPGDGHTGRCE